MEIRPLTLAAAFVAGLGLTAPTSADAASHAGRNHYHNHAIVRQHNANGVHNRMASVINSPNFMQGMQEVTNSNAGGNIITQNALCKRRTFCRLSNRAHISR
jgi:hypothetical protein